MQLLGTICCGLGCILGVFDFARGRSKFNQNDTRQAGHLIRNQGQAPSPLVNALLKAELIGWQRVHEEGTVQGHFYDLLSQFICGTQGHVGHCHFLQIRNVLFQILQGIFDLQSKQTAQAFTVFLSCHFEFVKHLNLHRIVQVYQGWETNQALPAFVDFHELWQITKGPCGVALLGNGRLLTRLGP